MQENETAKSQQQGLSLTANDFASLAVARSGMYEFLAGLCVKPSADAVKSMLLHPVSLPKGSLVAPTLRSAVEAFQSCRPDFAKDGTELSLQVEWTKLFRGVARGYSPPPPYESVYKDGMLSGPATVAVCDAYAKNGIGLSKDSTELPDFIGVEFKFMATLAAKEADTWKADATGARRLIGAQKEFATEHMRPWIPRFCEKAKKLAKTEFYRSAIDVIRSVSEWDAKLLEGIEETASGAG